MGLAFFIFPPFWVPVALPPLPGTGRLFVAAGLLAAQPHLLYRPAGGFGVAGMAAPLALFLRLFGYHTVGLFETSSFLCPSAPPVFRVWSPSGQKAAIPFIHILLVVAFVLAGAVPFMARARLVFPPLPLFAVLFPFASGHPVLDRPVV